MIRKLGFLFCFVAGAALAHSGVQNPTVKTRMDAMSVIGKNTKVLGTMAKGEVAFDAPTAQAAAAAIASHAAQIADVFRDPATDPKSEALPAIWQSYDDFSAKADELERAASDAAQGLATPGDLAPALAAIGGTCKSCHQTYRK